MFGVGGEDAVSSACWLDCGDVGVAFFFFGGGVVFVGVFCGVCCGLLFSVPGVAVVRVLLWVLLVCLVVGRGVHLCPCPSVGGGPLV